MVTLYTSLNTTIKRFWSFEYVCSFIKRQLHVFEPRKNGHKNQVKQAQNPGQVTGHWYRWTADVHPDYYIKDLEL